MFDWSSSMARTVLILCIEADERVKVESATFAKAAISGAAATNDKKGGGLGRTMGGYIDDTFNWDHIAWLRKATKLPIVAKGVQTAEDAVLAVKHGLDGIVITNHGGRNLDTYANRQFQHRSVESFSNIS
jgi:L-lactate dehydrogenase (cytochrome)